jgi:hypothetical protein
VTNDIEGQKKYKEFKIQKTFDPKKEKPAFPLIRKAGFTFTLPA